MEQLGLSDAEVTSSASLHRQQAGWAFQKILDSRTFLFVLIVTLSCCGLTDLNVHINNKDVISDPRRAELSSTPLCVTRAEETLVLISPPGPFTLSQLYFFLFFSSVSYSWPTEPILAPLFSLLWC